MFGHNSTAKLLASILAAGATEYRMLHRRFSAETDKPYKGTNVPGTFGSCQGSRRARKNCERIAFAMGTRRRVRS